MGPKSPKFRLSILFFAFLAYFYVLYVIREMSKIDKFILSAIGFIVLLSFAIWAAPSLIKKDKYESYNVRGHWFKDNRGPRI